MLMAQIINMPNYKKHDPVEKHGPARVYSFETFENYRTFRQPTESSRRKLSTMLGTAAAAVLISIGPAYYHMPFIRSRTPYEDMPATTYASGSC